jgi:hypothetical protein
MDPDCKGLRVILASPTYGPVDPDCAKSIRVAMMSAAKHGVIWEGDASMDRLPYGASRNKTAQAVFMNKELYDGIMWIDSDIVVPVNAITALLATVVERNMTFVTGVYHQREAPYLPVFYEYSEKIGKFKANGKYPENMIAECSGCGFGFVYTGVDVLTAIEKLPDFDPITGWFPDKRDAGGCGEDLSFCLQAIHAKKQLHVHTGVQVGHLGSARPVSAVDFAAYVKENGLPKEMGIPGGESNVSQS